MKKAQRGLGILQPGEAFFAVFRQGKQLAIDMKYLFWTISLA